MSDINKVMKGLLLLAVDLNRNNIKWSLGASLLLKLKGFDVSVTDIDIVVDESDLEQLLLMLKKYNYTYQEPNELYSTEHFYSLQSNGIDVDIMVNFMVSNENGLYKYPFHVEESIELEGELIYLSSIEEWLIAYKEMGRTNKVKMIEQYFKK